MCIDIQPYDTLQAMEAPDVLNIGGFSDDVFRLLALFAADALHPDHWVGAIQQQAL